MKKIELLAPAGGPEQYIAAVENGADAVYLGGPQFNARINAENFILEELKQAVDYGHLRGVRTFVTMNTLMKDDELDKAVEYAKQLYTMGVDALIIQDLGLGLRIREEMPDFELHLSTQASVYNAEGVRAAAKLGYRRVVLARELSLAEIGECVEEGKKLGVEIETFVHGAMCYCYSGQCQLSRYIGMYALDSDDMANGEKRALIRSGNRGTCAQPCRLPYTYIYEDGTKSENRYPLSPKDLCMIDNLGELVDMGVASLKIEGRMKSAEYVAVVTGIYRKYINAYLKQGKYTVSAEDRLKLAQIFNRGGFTEGYSHNDPDEDFMCGTTPKNQGIEIGTVLSSKGSYATIELNGPLDMHDVVEIRKDNGGETQNVSFKVTYLQKISAETAKIGDLKDKVEYGDKLYRLVSERLKKEAEDLMNGMDFSNIRFSKPTGRKNTADLTLIAKKGEPLRLTARCTGINGGKITVNEELQAFTVEQAQKNITTEVEMENQLRKTGNTVFAVGKIRIIADDDIFIPLSKLNELRRNALERLADLVIEKARRVMPERRSGGERDENAGYESKGANRQLSFEEVVERENTVILPQITKGRYDCELRQIADSLVSKLSATKGAAVVNNIGELMLLNELFEKSTGETGIGGVDIIGGYGLNIYNRETVRAYSIIGMDDYVPASEGYTMKEMSGIPLMVTEHRMLPGTLIDRKGAKYAVEYNPEDHKSYIFALD